MFQVHWWALKMHPINPIHQGRQFHEKTLNRLIDHKQSVLIFEKDEAQSRIANEKHQK